MNLFKKHQTALLLMAVFAGSFLTGFMAIVLTQSAYSIPVSTVTAHDGMEISLGPPPNSTNVPINTAISVDAVASAALNDLRLTPGVPFTRAYSEASSALTYLTTFYPAHLLDPGTRYNVSVTILGTPLSWSFTTSNEPFNPGIGFYLATNAPWIALATAILATLIVAVANLLRRKVQGKGSASG